MSNIHSFEVLQRDAAAPATEQGQPQGKVNVVDAPAKEPAPATGPYKPVDPDVSQAPGDATYAETVETGGAGAQPKRKPKAGEPLSNEPNYQWAQRHAGQGEAPAGQKGREAAREAASAVKGAARDAADAAAGAAHGAAERAREAEAAASHAAARAREYAGDKTEQARAAAHDAAAQAREVAGKGAAQVREVAGYAAAQAREAAGTAAAQAREYAAAAGERLGEAGEAVRERAAAGVEYVQEHLPAVHYDPGAAEPATEAEAASQDALDNAMAIATGAPPPVRRPAQVATRGRKPGSAPPTPVAPRTPDVSATERQPRALARNSTDISDQLREEAERVAAGPEGWADQHVAPTRELGTAAPHLNTTMQPGTVDPAHAMAAKTEALARDAEGWIKRAERPAREFAERVRDVEVISPDDTSPHHVHDPAYEAAMKTRRAAHDVGEWVHRKDRPAREFAERVRDVEFISPDDTSPHRVHDPAYEAAMKTRQTARNVANWSHRTADEVRDDAQHLREATSDRAERDAQAVAAAARSVGDEVAEAAREAAPDELRRRADREAMAEGEQPGSIGGIMGAVRGAASYIKAHIPGLGSSASTVEPAPPSGGRQPHVREIRAGPGDIHIGQIEHALRDKLIGTPEAGQAKESSPRRLASAVDPVGEPAASPVTEAQAAEDSRLAAGEVPSDTASILASKGVTA